jgi:hypothetical protein
MVLNEQSDRSLEAGYDEAKSKAVLAAIPDLMFRVPRSDQGFIAAMASNHGI